jgi:hypothetical protein
MTDNIDELTHEDGHEVKMIITSNPTSKHGSFYKKWLESFNQREVEWFISKNALKEWEDTDDNK